MLSVRYRLTQEREDRRAALSAWLLANINRDSDNRPVPFDLEEVVSWLGHGFQRTSAPPPSEPLDRGPGQAAPPPVEGPLTVEQGIERVKMLHELYKGPSNGQQMDR